MENVICKSHHAVVTISGDIDEPMMLQLATSLQQLHHGCYYNHIELEISSPGGQVKALDYCVEVMERLRSQGVTFTTRALMSASSAAANLVSLGDRRETSRTATLLYHKARAQGVDQVTAQSAREILTEVDRIDEHYLGRLVEQARKQAEEQARRPVVKRPNLYVRDFSNSDWSVVKHLLIGAGVVQARHDGGKQNPRAQLERLRKHMSACLADDNDQMLKQLYKRLFELDQAISAALALELWLVDCFVDTNSGLESSETADGLKVEEWKPLYGPEGWIDRKSLCRHMLFLGETGSGKTASGVLPLVGSIMAPDNRTVGCALVIDPKREILSHLETMAHEGIKTYHIDPKQDKRPTLNLMAWTQEDVDKDLAEHNYLKVAREILIRSASLSSSSPATILAGEIRGNPPELIWPQEGSQLATTVLAFVLLILNNYNDIYDSYSTLLKEAEKKRIDGNISTILQGLEKSDDDVYLVFELLLELGEEAGMVAIQKIDETEVSDLPDSIIDTIRAWTVDGEDEEDAIPEIYDCYFAFERDARSAQTFIDTVTESRLYQHNTEFRKQFDDTGLLSETDCYGRTAGTGYLDIFEADTEQLVRMVEERQRILHKAKKLVMSWRLKGTEVIREERDIQNAPNILVLADMALVSWFSTKEQAEHTALVLVNQLKYLIGAGDAPKIYRDIEKRYDEMDAHKYWVGVASEARRCFYDYAHHTPATTLYFGVEPYYRSVVKYGREGIEQLDFTGVVDDREQRAVYVFQPDLKINEAFVARALKATWFEAILYSEQRVKDGASMPLAAYIADEFHRFITSDKVHGEQSFLDTCRSFGAFCALACQSISSMEHALAESTGNSDKNRAAVSILLNNTANKLFFRSTDRELKWHMSDLCPSVPGLGQVTSVRPPSTLKPGECYASLANGRFERCQLRLFDARQNASGDVGPRRRVST